MRVLIIGGTGLTGPYVVRRLAELGHELALFHRGSSNIDLPTGIRHILGDQHDLQGFGDELRGFGPEIVVHMIATSEAHALNVMAMFRGIARRIVAISSQDVYHAYGRLIGLETGPLDRIPVSEDDPVRTSLYPYRDKVTDADHPLYDYDKILVERTILGSPELPGTILRYPMVYGPRDRQHRLFPYLKRMDDGRTEIILDQGMAGWRWTRGYAENVAAAVVLAVTNDRASSRVFNVGEPDTLSEAQWVRAIGSAAGWEGRVVVLPADRLPQSMRPEMDTDQDLVADTSRIRQELGYTEVVTREEALSRTVIWQRSHPPDQIDPLQFDYAAEDAILASLNHSDELPSRPGSE
jgi:nucleoside-diphosphate-sugar epimerase